MEDFFDNYTSKLPLETAINKRKPIKVSQYVAPSMMYGGFF